MKYQRVLRQLRIFMRSLNILKRIISSAKFLFTSMRFPALSVEAPHGLHYNGGIVPMDPSRNGTERIWPLLSNTVLVIDDVLRNLESFLHNVRKVFERLREFNVSVNPAKTKLGLAEVEYVGHVISPTGISFTEEKLLKVIKFP
jgi:hypothetical protein